MHYDNNTEKFNEVSEVVALTLRLLNVPCNMDGFVYLKFAIRHCILGNSTQGIKTLVYPKIANQFYQSPEEIESEINKAIQAAWESNHGTYLYCVFGLITDATPSDVDFIATLANRCNNMCSK
jgi:hypothetical protein